MTPTWLIRTPGHPHCLPEHPDSPSCVTNVSISPHLLAEARQLGINISRAAEQGLVRAIAERRAVVRLEKTGLRSTARAHSSRRRGCLWCGTAASDGASRCVKVGLISTKAPQVVGLPQFQGTPLWEASLWAKVCRRSVAERARLPQGRPLKQRQFDRSLPGVFARGRTSASDCVYCIGVSKSCVFWRLKGRFSRKKYVFKGPGCSRPVRVCQIFSEQQGGR